MLSSKWLWAAAFGVSLAIFVAPEIAVRRARAKATRCLEQARGPRGPVLPECGTIVRDFDYPTDFSYTRHDATYRAEELISRIAMNRYIDAAVGDPNPERLAFGADATRSAQELVEAGSRRISFEELGSSSGAPHLGKLASWLGDRRALTASPEYFGLWYIRRDVMEASFVDADFEQVDDIARRYAAWDPSDADLVTTLGAALCITAPPEGYDLLEKLPARRAEKRYENLQRNYGELFAALTACANKAGTTAPILPEEGNAGVADMATVRRLVDLRLALPGKDRAARVRRAIDALSASGNDPLDTDQPFARAMLLAAVVTLSDQPIEPAVLADLATPRVSDGEGPLAPPAVTLRAILVRPQGLYPVVPASWLDDAARILAEASRTAPAPNRETLERAAGALFIHAAIEHAGDGHVDAAMESAASGARWSHASEAVEALSIATAAWVAGDATRALAALDRHSSKPEGKSEVDVDLALSALEALVAGSAGDRARAERVASTLVEEAKATESVDLAAHARWTAVALAPASVVADGAGSGAVATMWTGLGDPVARHRDRAGPAIEATQLAWARALGQGGNERRAFRYQLLDKRGDLPGLALPALIAGGALLDPGTSSDGVEIWLDTLTALDSRRMRLRSYAWMRMEAAKIRGDVYATDLWAERLAVLREVSSDEDNLELARFLRF